MAVVWYDHIADSTTSTGGLATPVALANAPPQYYNTYGARYSVAQTVPYCIQHQTLNEWEVGYGTYSATNQITRVTVIDSSAGAGTAVTFSAGTKDVFVPAPSNPIYMGGDTDLTWTRASGLLNKLHTAFGADAAISGTSAVVINETAATNNLLSQGTNSLNTFEGTVKVTGAKQTTSATSGSLQVVGGVGINNGVFWQFCDSSSFQANAGRATYFDKQVDNTNAGSYVFTNVGGQFADSGGGAFWRGIRFGSPQITVSGSPFFPQVSQYYEYDTYTNPTYCRFIEDVGAGGSGLSAEKHYRIDSVDQVVVFKSSATRIQFGLQGGYAAGANIARTTGPYGVIQFADGTYTPYASSAYWDTAYARIGANLTGSSPASAGQGNQFVLLVEAQTPTTSDVFSYQHNAAMFISRTAANSTGTNELGAVGSESRGFVGSTCTTGQAWGALSGAYIEAGGDGFTVGHEIDCVNNGTDQATLNTLTTKIGLLIAALGSNNTTCAILLSTGGKVFHKGLFSDINALVAPASDANAVFIGLNTGATVLYRVDTAGWVQEGVGQKRTTAQFDKTSNVTLSDVTGLSVTLIAGRTYFFSAVLFCATGASTGGVKAAIAGTATATAIRYEGYVDDANTRSGSTRATALATAVAAVTTSSTTPTVTIRGVITVNAAGTLTVQFAQNASNASTSSVLTGSTFVVKEMA